MEDRLYSNVIYDDLTSKQKEFIDLAETPNSKVFLTGCLVQEKHFWQQLLH